MTVFWFVGGCRNVFREYECVCDWQCSYYNQVNKRPRCLANILSMVVEKFTRWKMSNITQPRIDGVPEKLKEISDAIEIVPNI
jgi:hypothetical protein